MSFEENINKMSNGENRMFFLGNYEVEINSGNIVLPFDLHNNNFEMQCIENRATSEFYINVMQQNDVEYEEEQIIVERVEISTSKIKLPEKFIKYVENDKTVHVLGLGETIQIIKNSDFEKIPEGMEEEFQELIDIMSEIDL